MIILCVSYWHCFYLLTLFTYSSVLDRDALHVRRVQLVAATNVHRSRDVKLDGYT